VYRRAAAAGRLETQANRKVGMDPICIEYDARYLAGVLFFNQRDFFQAHEVWEDLWSDTQGPDHRFYQGLIQAAVGLYHFRNGNVRGAVKLYHSSRAYLHPYPSPHQGLDVAAFWEKMRRCFAPLLDTVPPPAIARPDEALIPTLRLDPEPAAWPDLADFDDHED
jgi:predicted metal-dependent hydrolase